MIFRFLAILLACIVLSVGTTSVGAQPVVLTLLHVNDVHGRVQLDDQPAGLTKIASLVDEIRDHMPHVMLFDGGDTISGQPETILTGGEGVIAAMNAMQFDAMVVGNHEFDRGHLVAEGVLAKAQFPVLSANLVNRNTGDPWPPVTPYIVRDIGGVRVAVFGLTTPSTMRFAYPRSMGDYQVTDPVEAARRLVSALRHDERADVVIALTHLGLGEDLKLAEAIEGIDLILGGHSHTTLEDQRWVGETLIVQTGAHARALGRVDLLLKPDAEEGFRIASVNGRDGRWWGQDGVPVPTNLSHVDALPRQVLLRPSTSTPDAASVVGAYAPYRDRTQSYLAETLGTVENPIDGTHAREVETPLGNLLADAVRNQAHADIAVYASSQFRPSTLEAGPVTMQDLYDFMGAYTRQHIVVLRSPGEHIRSMLESAVATPGRQPLHLSGARISPDGILLSGEQPLQDDHMYTVAGAAHVMQEYLIGREGVTVMEDDPTATNCRDALAAYIRERGSIHAPATDRTQRAEQTVNAGAAN